MEEHVNVMGRERGRRDGNGEIWKNGSKGAGIFFL
jgi:hypothetical protein